MIKKGAVNTAPFLFGAHLVFTSLMMVKCQQKIVLKLHRIINIFIHHHITTIITILKFYEDF